MREGEERKMARAGGGGLTGGATTGFVRRVTHITVLNHCDRVPLLPTSLNLVIPSILTTHTQACVAGFAKVKGRGELRIWADVVCAERIRDRRGPQCQEKQAPRVHRHVGRRLGFKQIIWQMLKPIFS